MDKPSTLKQAPGLDRVEANCAASDESEVFASYLPYRTREPRPVAGTAGLIPKSNGAAINGVIRWYERWRSLEAVTQPEDDGTYSLKQARMVGVAFWEKPVDGKNHIVCHGQESVHRILYDAIKAKWP